MAQNVKISTERRRKVWKLDEELDEDAICHSFIHLI
jgi:hypothetical protein